MTGRDTRKTRRGEGMIQIQTEHSPVGFSHHTMRNNTFVFSFITDILTMYLVLVIESKSLDSPLLGDWH